MNRQEIRDLTECPKCGAARGDVCVGRKNGANHFERLYRAQDIANGKPDRVTGEEFQNPFIARTCPACRKRLRTKDGVIHHLQDAHDVDAVTARMMVKDFISTQKARTSCDATDDDFEVIE